MSPLDNDALCPGCNQAIGDHTIRGYAACLEKAGFNYEMPFEEDPAGGFHLPGGNGLIAGEVSVAACVLPTAMGALPALRFIFTGPGSQPMERRQMDPITLVMEDVGLEAVARLVVQSVRSACEAARRAS